MRNPTCSGDSKCWTLSSRQRYKTDLQDDKHNEFGDIRMKAEAFK